MSVTVTVLGCGSSGGVPRIGGHWGNCDPSNPRNRRRRCSILVEARRGEGATRLLIDTSPDLRQQLLDAGTGELDGVTFSHAHADHTHGIDELRVVSLNMRRKIPVWADTLTSAMLKMRFGYAFATPEGSSYPPILDLSYIEPGNKFQVAGKGGELVVKPFEVEHGDTAALGFRIGSLAYTPDLNGVPSRSNDALEGLSCWIVDALRRVPHPSHWSLPETLKWIAHYRPARAIVTNLHIDLDYETLRRELPKTVEPAYDGMILDVT